MLIYLGGPITGKPSVAAANGWRVEAELNMPTGVRTLNPLRREIMLQQIVMQDGASSTGKTGATIFQADILDLERCDVVLANLRGADRVSIGTMIELGYAYALRKPIILIMEEHGNIHEHAFVRNAVQFTVTTLDEALDLVKKLA